MRRKGISFSRGHRFMTLYVASWHHQVWHSTMHIKTVISSSNQSINLSFLSVFLSLDCTGRNFYNILFRNERELLHSCYGYCIASGSSDVGLGTKLFVSSNINSFNLSLGRSSSSISNLSLASKIRNQVKLIFASEKESFCWILFWLDQKRGRPSFY